MLDIPLLGVLADGAGADKYTGLDGNAGLLRGAKGTTYEGGMRVPAIVRWPGKIEKGITSSDLVTTMDLFATMVNIAGAELPQDRSIDGNDAFPILMGKDTTITEKFYYLRGTNVQAVRKGEWKLRFTETIGHELFNLDIDPSEMYNVAEEHPELVSELYRELVVFSDETNANIEAAEN